MSVPLTYLLFASNVLETIKDESCKYTMGQTNCLHAFGYNSAESEQIWMKYRTNVVSQMLGLALADFGRDMRSSDSLTGSGNFLSGK